MKLNNLIKNNKVTVFGFPAFKGLEGFSKENEDMECVVSVLSPAIMHGMGINSYYAPVIPRNSRFNTTAEVLDADLDVNEICVMEFPSWDLVNKDRIVIVSRHKATIDILQDMYSDAPVLSGNVSADDIKNCHVIGTLPPTLIAECKSYRAVTITDYNAAEDGDLSATEIKDRLVINEPISVIIK